MSLKKKLCAGLLGIIMLVGCSKEEELALAGNLVDPVLEPGDIYAVVSFLDYGEITFKLFPQIAPNAVEKFVALAERGFYDRKTIHRVIEDSLIQGGSLIGDGTDGDVDKNEFLELETSVYARNFYGALAMAPNGDGKSYSQFYIVNNKKSVDIDADIEKLAAQLDDPELIISDEVRAIYTANLEMLKGIPEKVKENYLSMGGVYTFDDKSTVIGQIMSGFEVLDAMSVVETVSGNAKDDSVGIKSKPATTIVIEKIEIIRIPLPEPTTSPEETSETKKTKKTSAKTEAEEALTDVVDINEMTTTAPVDENEPLDSETDEIEEISEE